MILILIILAALGASILAACGDQDDETAPTVVASTGILADLTERVAGGDVDVVQVIPDTTSPHDFQPSAEDRQKVAEADLLVVNGGGLDASVPDDADAPVWTLTEEAPEPLAFASEHEHGDEEHAEEEHEGGIDPHVWMDPTRVAAALPALAAALGEADPANADGYERRARGLAGELEALDRTISSQLDSIPDPDRLLVTSHDALGYFADRYGFDVVATVFPATGADAEASAGALAEVIDTVEATGVPALFAEETDDPEALDSIAAESGAAVVSDLLVESPGSAGTYEEMMSRDAELISGALAP
jgi:zinc/manganese transport system substrate-binding protein